MFSQNKMKYFSTYVKYTVVLSLILSCTYGLQCLDENNIPVDWFVVYKLPRVQHSHNENMTTGLAYMYMTSKNYNSWMLANVSINDSKSIIANTIFSLYKNDDQNIYILYNDEPPNGPTRNSQGHTKGVILSNEEGGLWLIHSVPHFPFMGSKYVYPSTGTRYGQSFLCISLDLENLNKIGLQLQYNEPAIYAQHIYNIDNKIPDLEKAAAKNTIQNAPWFHLAEIQSLNGVNYMTFAKSKRFGKDLYEDWVAPVLQTNLLVETWPNGPGRLPSNCDKLFRVNNVESISMQLANISFKSTHDHSKWAVSSDANNTNWICIGDINRAEHQKSRGGGTVCMQNIGLASNYHKLVTAVEECTKKH